MKLGITIISMSIISTCIPCCLSQVNFTAASELYIQQRYNDMYELLGYPASTVNLVNLRGWLQFGVMKFLGVPYAQPPVGSLRFEKPLPHPGWKGILNATTAGSYCPQFSPDFLANPGTANENCLLLDIYVPERRPEETSEGSVLAKTGRMIVVAANYRLGLLGFMASGDQRFTGNLGLYDQKMAIQWVKDNIGMYGGNSNSITISGHSAGGLSVVAQLLSPLNNASLFQRAIIVSCSPRLTEPMARNLNDLRQTELKTFNTILTSSGCNNSVDAIACWKALPTATFVQFVAATSLVDLYNPTLDISFGNEFLPGTPNNVEALAALMDQYKIIFGQAQQEGAASVAFTTTDQDLAFIVNSVLDFAGENNTSLKAKRVLEHVYTNFIETDLEIKRQRELSKFFNDWIYYVPVVQFAALATQHNVPTYLFRFTGPIGESTFSRNAPFLRPDTMHVDTAVYLFGLPLILNFSSSDVTRSHNFISLMANFVHSGDPNAGTSFEEKWSVYDPIQKNTFEISEQLGTEYNVYARAEDLWSGVLDNLNTDTCPSPTSSPCPAATTSGSLSLFARWLVSGFCLTVHKFLTSV